MWKCVSIVSMCLGCLYLVTLEVWKCGNVEMWKYVFIVLIFLVTLDVWKRGNVEICLHCLYLSTNSGSVEVWKCGNMSSLSSSGNSGSVEV